MDATQQTIALFDKYALSYSIKYGDVKHYAEGLDLFCKLVTKPNAKILECACGPGNVTSYLLSQRSDFMFKSIDLAPGMLEIAKQTNPSAEFLQMDIRQISQLTESFNAIVCAFGLPYLNFDELNQFVANCWNLLTESGVLYLSAIESEINYSKIEKASTGEEILMHYYSAACLKEVVQSNKFELLFTQSLDFPNHLNLKGKDLILLAKRIS